MNLPRGPQTVSLKMASTAAAPRPAPPNAPAKLQVAVDKANIRLAKTLEKGRKASMAVKLGAPPVTVLSSAAPAPARESAPPVVHHITHDQIADILNVGRQVAGGLVGAVAPRWKAKQNAILNGRDSSDGLVAAADSLLGRVLVTITKLEAADREGRGAIVGENELADFEKCEDLAAKMGG